ncbi:MAG TPA: hypothetical protein VMU73_07685, partial [Gaiellaceae bacterium]|nr:hypothetical protein [Gaiellaceae bacterium]
FPHLIAAPFQSGLREAFSFAMAASLVAAVASWLRGGKYVHGAVPSSVLIEAEIGAAEAGAAVAGAEAGAGETVASEEVAATAPASRSRAVGAAGRD